MSATEREVFFEVARKGGLPTEPEFTAVWEALSNVHEFGLDRLVQRIAEPLVDAFEAEDDGTRVDWTYQDAGVLAAHIDMLVEQCKWLHSPLRNFSGSA